MPLYLSSDVNPTDVFRSGLLDEDVPPSGGPDFYVYDPRDVSRAELESSLDDDASLTDQRILHAAIGNILVYHSPPFEQDTEVSGFFRFVAWLSIDQPDTDFRVTVYEVCLDGSTVLLTSDLLRARYRSSLREASLVRSNEPMLYEFNRFTFVARLIPRRHRLRLVLDSKDSIYEQRNYNRGGIVSAESMQDAQSVTIRLFHDAHHQSALYVPLGQENTLGE
jgi:predicted acyl esterase